MGYLGANIDAGVNAGANGLTKVSLRDVTIVRDETDDGLRVTSRTGSVLRFVENWKKESWVLDAKRGGSTFGARRREANLRPMEAARDGGQMNNTA